MLTFWKNNAELTKIKAVLALCGIFSENICVYTYVPYFKFLV